MMLPVINTSWLSKNARLSPKISRQWTTSWGKACTLRWFWLVAKFASVSCPIPLANLMRFVTSLSTPWFALLKKRHWCGHLAAPLTHRKSKLAVLWCRAHWAHKEARSTRVTHFGKTKTTWSLLFFLLVISPSVILTFLALTLHSLHKAGYVHGDMKDGNLLRTPANDPLLIDLGTVQRIDSQSFLLQGTTGITFD